VKDGLQRIIDYRKNIGPGKGLDNFLICGKILLDNSGGVAVDIQDPNEDGESIPLVEKFFQAKRRYEFSCLREDVSPVLEACSFVFSVPADEIRSLLEHKLLKPLEAEIAAVLVAQRVMPSVA